MSTPVRFTPEELSQFVNDDLREAAERAGIEPGSLIGIGEGLVLHVEDDGETWADYGPCGWCNQGNYIGSPNAGFGICNVCGAI